jgi:hypothetical protein
MKTFLAALSVISLLTGSAVAQVQSRPVPTGIDVPGPACIIENTRTQTYTPAKCDGFKDGGYVFGIRPIADPILQNSLNNRPQGYSLFGGGGSSAGGAGE